MKYIEQPDKWLSNKESTDDEWIIDSRCLSGISNKWKYITNHYIYIKFFFTYCPFSSHLHR